MVRFVISARDPGVPNWLDTIGHPTGQFQGRWFRSEGATLPTAKKVPVADVLVAIAQAPQRRLRVVGVHDREVLHAVFPGAKESKAATNVVPIRARKKKEKGASLPIKGLIPGMAVHYAGCCHPLPGDRIVGILTAGEGITIYPIQSPALTAFDDQPERWLDVRWDIDAETRELFPARVISTALNEPGTLGTLATLIGETGANIDNIRFKAHSPDFREMIFDLEVADLKHLTTVISRLRESPLVSKVERFIG